jgi:predicted nucleic acid-binding protein
VIVVSNASPLINLARIGDLDLLRRLYGEIVIPEAVWDEVGVSGVGQPGATEVARATWIQKQAPGNRALVQVLRQDLAAGEAQALVRRFES